MDKLAVKVRKNISARRLLGPGESLLVAVSGGVDSMVLLDILRHLSKHGEFTLSVAHFNHQLRGKASQLDEGLVRKYCEQHQLRFVAGRGQVKALSVERKISVEMAARELRHEFLAATAKATKSSKIALAHHADDQVELFYLRLFRGSSVDGLGGMAWCGVSPKSADVSLLRPLLNISKADLVAYARRNELPFREDQTNRDEDILRNRVRRKLLPFIEKHFGEASIATVQRTMDVLAAEAEAMADTAKAFAKPSQLFATLPVAIQRRLLREQLIKLGVPESYELIEELRLSEGGRVQIGRDHYLQCTKFGGIEEANSGNLDFNSEQVKFRLSGKKGTQVFAGREFDWSLERQSGVFQKPKPGKNVELFDADKVGSVVRLRFWQAGDRFQPLGMKEPVKLKNWFINRKLPAADRRRLVIAETEDGRIFWVQGERIGEQFKLDKGTRQRLKWSWQVVSSPP